MKRILFLLLFIICLSGCKTTHEIPVIHDTTYIVNTEYKNRYLHDSVYVDRYHEIFVKGDTVIIHDSVYEHGTIQFYDTVKVTDTCYRYKDVPVEVIKEKKVVPGWCWILLIVNLITVGLYVWCRYRKH